MVEILNQDLRYYGKFDPEDPNTFPYYRILTGDSTLATEEIKGWVPSLQIELSLNQSNLTYYPDMRSFYDNTDNLTNLLNRYPNDQFLIRRILNPVTNIQDAIDSKNLALLVTKYPSKSLNEHENEDLIQFLKDFLERFEYRWYINVFEYEDLYPLAFWSTLWYLLPIVLNTRRILNIRTNQVHSYHLWEHLTSVGYGSYRGYLSRRQELFLYRNYDYLRYNVGKKATLDVLELEFLRPMKYSLSEKMIISHTTDREETHDKEPEIVPRKGKLPDYQSSVNFDYFLSEINRNDLDPRGDIEYQSDISSSFGKSPSNELMTKFIELVRNIDNSEMMLLIRFILDSIAYLNSNYQLSFPILITNPVTGQVISFQTVTDALNLFYYCVHNQDPPINTPIRYSSVSAITTREAPDVQEMFNVANKKYLTKSFASVDEIINSVPYIPTVIFSPAELSRKLGIQYAWVFERFIKLRGISDTSQHEAHVIVYRSLIPEEHVIPVHQEYATYQEYFDAYPAVSAMFQETIQPEDYVDIMLAIFEAICPLSQGFETLARDDEAASVLVHKIREVFTYLTSYNVAFITPISSNQEEFELPKLTLDVDHNDCSENIDAPDWARNCFDYTANVDSHIDNEITIELEPILNLLNNEISDILETPSESFDKDLVDKISSSKILYVTECGLTAHIESIESEP